MSFEDYAHCYIVVDGMEIRCTVGNDRGSDQIMILCQEPDTEYFRLGEMILAAWHIELTDNLWIMQDDAGCEYVFVRIE